MTTTYGFTTPTLKNALQPGQFFLEQDGTHFTLFIAGEVAAPQDDQMDVLLWQQQGGPSHSSGAHQVYRDGVSRIVGVLPELEVRPALGTQLFYQSPSTTPGASSGSLAITTAGALLARISGGFWCDLSTGTLTSGNVSGFIYPHWSLGWNDGDTFHELAAF